MLKTFKFFLIKIILTNNLFWTKYVMNIIALTRMLTVGTQRNFTIKYIT